MAFKNIKKNFRHKRVSQWLRVNLQLLRRRIRRTTKNIGGRKIAVTTVGLTLSLGVIVGIHLFALYTPTTEQKLLSELTYGADYDSKVPYFRTLHAIGSSNHLCVSLTTAEVDNLKDRDVALYDGGVNLKLSFTDGTSKELPLKEKYRFDSFSPGRTTDFIVTLPFGYSPFDIASCAVSITPGAEGGYDEWLCKQAVVSFMLCEKRVVIAEDNWKTPARFGNGADLLRSTQLQDKRTNNANYQQMKLLYERLLSLAKKGMTNFADNNLKSAALESLALSNANALYLDLETVSSTRNAEILGQAIYERIPETESLNYNGILYVDITFYGELEDGTHTKRYEFDTPGKDDFEMSGASTLRMEMPNGMSVFDIAGVSLRTSDLEDAWAPRFARLYLTLNYSQELEVSRLTDAYLEKEAGSCVFYEGFLEQITFDLRQTNAISSDQIEYIEDNFNHTLSDDAHAMYFESQSFFNRQIAFYDRMNELYDPEAK